MVGLLAGILGGIVASLGTGLGAAAVIVAAIVAGLAAGLAVWLAGEFRDGLIYGPESPYVLLDWMALGLVAGSLVGLVYLQAWSSSLAFMQLAASDRTPVRLMRFLEDARSRSVLRTVGPIYQFRHARLQDRLAAPEPATRPGGPSPAAGDDTARSRSTDASGRSQ